MNPIIETLLDETLRQIAAGRRFPESTYRVQFHAGFTFRDAARLVPYLHDLGITDLYASPYLRARPGSTHGYDISDHRVLNPEIGSEEDFAALVAELDQRGMGQLVDTVPNHMGIMGNENVWWKDVLENGPASPYATYFDISWYSSPRPELHGKVLLPVLGDPYGKVLESGQLRLEYTAGTFTITYYELRLPVAPRSYTLVLENALTDLAAVDKDSPPMLEYLSIVTAVRHLPDRTETDPEKLAERNREKEVIKRRLAVLTEASPEVREGLERAVARFNGRPGEARSFDLLDELLGKQSFRLSYWRVASDEINYRRFFDINELAALSMEREDVFETTHGLTLRLLLEGKVHGLRIDHPDGLYDPRQYLQRLQERYLLGRAQKVFESHEEFTGLEWPAIEKLLREHLHRVVFQEGRGEGPGRWPLYVLVEKILIGSEALPADWPVHGTTGYDFLNVLGGVFVDTNHAQAFSEIYQDWTLDDRTYDEVVYQKKVLILQSALSSELHTLAHQLDRLAQRDRWSRDFTLNGLRHALRQVIACFPVYRSYISDEGVSDTDRKHVQRAIQRARPRNPSLSRALFDFIRDMLLLKPPRPGTVDESYHAEQRRFAGKFQQVTAPVTAKGMEDTAFYVYNRLLSLNEVGGEPSRFGISPGSVHRNFQDRQAKWPRALSSLSTHDTKRSEDVRARLNVLSELPEEWAANLTRWSQLNERHRVEVEDLRAPDANEEYLLYQSLLGAWPLGDVSPEEHATFVQRVQGFLQKALHEAKVHTSWINPNPAYDEAVQKFVAAVLDREQSGEFLAEFLVFQRKLSHYGLFNSLAQTLLKITAPGVPDTYQGTELWDFSLTDPDNRRPVDYERRRRLLSELQESARGDQRRLASELVEYREDGRAKLYVTYRALHCRRENPGLFAGGAYVPLEIGGVGQEYALAFLRRDDRRTAVVVVPRLLARLVPQGHAPLGEEVWRDTAVLLPELSGTLVNVFTGEELTAVGTPGRLPLGSVFQHFPVALLTTA